MGASTAEEFEMLAGAASKPDELEIAESWVQRALERGAAQAEARVVSASGRRWSGSDLRALSDAPTRRATLDLRVWDSAGRAHRGSGSLERGGEVLAQAWAAPAEQDWPPLAASPPLRGGLGLDDRRLDGLRDADRQEWIALALGALQAAPSVSLLQACYAEERETRAIASSAGLRAKETRTLFELSAQLEACWRARRLTSRVAQRACTFAAVGTVPLIEVAVRRLAKLAATDLPEAPGGPVQVALGPWAVARLLPALVEVLEGRARRAGEDGVGLASLPLDPRLTLVDDPTLPGAPGSRAFDDRGAPCRPVVLVRGGRWLGGRVLRAEARAQGTQATGHDGADGVLPGQLVLAPGIRSLVAAAADRRVPTLWIDELDPADVVVDGARGEIHLTVTAPLVMRGQWLSAARRRALVGSWSAVLGRVLDLSADTDRVEGVDAAGLLVEGFVLTEPEEDGGR